MEDWQPLLISGTNAEEYSNNKNAQTISVGTKKGYKIFIVILKCFLFHSSRGIKEWVGCFPYKIWKVCVQQAWTTLFWSESWMFDARLIWPKMWNSEWKGVITVAALKPVHEILLRSSVDMAVHGNSSRTSELQLLDE